MICHILNRIELEADDEVSIPSYFIDRAGIRFMLISRFHDAKIIQVACAEKYGKSCVIMQIDFSGTTTEFKAGFKKFNIYFINAEHSEIPNIRNVRLCDKSRKPG